MGGQNKGLARSLLREELFFATDLLSSPASALSRRQWRTPGYLTASFYLLGAPLPARDSLKRDPIEIRFS